MVLFILKEIYENKILWYLLYTLTLFYIFRILNFIYKNFFRRKHNFRQRYGEGSWALVTGGAFGLGRSFVEELAREGFNLIIASLEPLEIVKNSLDESLKNVKYHYIQIDFNKKNRISDYEEIFGKLTEQFDISILVNNVGVLRYSDSPNIKDDLMMVNVNVITMTSLTDIFIDYLSKRNKRSAIINVSSVASYTYSTNFPVYSATKSYISYVSMALAEMYKNNNIDVLVMKPIAFQSAMTDKKADGIWILHPDQCVKGTLNDLGYERETNGHWVHKIQAFILRSLPRSLFDPCLELIDSLGTPVTKKSD